jgi:hypothetical protein
MGVLWRGVVRVSWARIGGCRACRPANQILPDTAKYRAVSPNAPDCTVPIQLEQAIRDYLAANNRNPKPFTWTKTADQILESIKRFCMRTSNSGH